MKRLSYSYHCLSRVCKWVRALFFALLCVVLIGFASACNREISYYDYVSELRSNYFIAETHGFHLRVFAIEREYPYAMDGVKHDTSTRAEFHLVAPSGEETVLLHFSVNEQTYGGEMSYDVVKAEYYYSCALDISQTPMLECKISYGETAFTLQARSVKTADTLSPREALEGVYQNDPELFASLTDKYGFCGEICIRLIYEENPYYYIGVIDRNGKITAFLLNAESGKVLAKRQS